MVENGDRRGGNILGLGGKIQNGPTLMWPLSLTVDTEENQRVILPIARQLVGAINRKLRQQEGFVEWYCLNYSWGDINPFQYFGSNNLGLMERVCAKYDPDGMFQILRQTGFSLGHG
ncbi:berberine and berberine like domain-containing protein [Pochonia chlamydosporia 170]|uniref:Berberine and berberine like domain-containing protein n=1 Tax=Pochonia chlamydosporia 170 TaxID=1380566 RepID=A0A179FAY2_METCM|nr:berberine and berberine like domain-containing protein [Pochonia chlamydosporia 170]OAQ62624.1 berberine and berberine like domain-containing protein [Pochonia chlamydosporia 170]